VFYDNEFIQPQLAESLQTFLRPTANYSVLNVYKRDFGPDGSHAYIAPRFFKKHVLIKNDCLVPRESTVVIAETALDGWVFSSKDVYVTGGPVVLY